MSVIEVNNLTKDYGSGRGVFDVSLSVNEGEVFGFLGPNGAGKSTTIRHLLGFSKPQSGECKIFGKDTFQKYYEILSSVGYIPGEIALPAGLTGYGFIEMMQKLQHNKNDARLKEMLGLFELKDNVLKGETKRMSLGVKRKLAVVTAFMSDPEVLILDEPTSGLDPVMQEVFIKFIEDEKARGKTVLLSSHIFSEVDATCDRIAIIKDGRIVSQFLADDLKHASQKTYKIRLCDSAEFDRFMSDSKNTNAFTVIKNRPDSLSVTLSTSDDKVNDVIAILSKYSMTEFTHRKETLEDYFMKFYKEDRTFEGVNGV